MKETAGMTYPVFDGHNDVLFRIWDRAVSTGSDPVAEFLDGAADGHIDRKKALAGGLAGGLCAVFVPSGKLRLATPGPDGGYETPLSDPVASEDALKSALAIMAIAFRIERAGGWSICRSTHDIRRALSTCAFAAVLHMEGAEAIGSDLCALETLYAAGLRSLGPVWSRHNIFGHGVPFAYPKTPDTAPGLTEAGFALVKECNRLGIAVDLSHLTEQGFWDVARTSHKPLIASHSNAHALTPVARNLTDRQLDAVRESRGIVGLNFATTMLRPDGREEAETQIEHMVRHIDHLVERMGMDCVGLGSDFDGATIPVGISDASGLPNLTRALRQAGYGETDLEKICRENWLRVLDETWRS